MRAVDNFYQEMTMRGWWIRAVAPGMMAVAVCSTALAAQAADGSDLCSLATDEEFQKAQGIDPRIGIIPSDPPVVTMMNWGPHCDYGPGAIDLFNTKSPEAELDRVLKLTQGGKQRVPVQGFGKRAFFTTVYPEDRYRRRGLLAIYLDDRILAISMDPKGDDTPESTKPKIEELAKVVMTRVE
ncbi:MAG TPA: hypothetical protein VFR62_12285 [Gemmatimonadales bacterium]|nr:hypothetical protein [Gemmatimonadales bacterium]